MILKKWVPTIMNEGSHIKHIDVSIMICFGLLMFFIWVHPSSVAGQGLRPGCGENLSQSWETGVEVEKTSLFLSENNAASHGEGSLTMKVMFLKSPLVLITKRASSSMVGAVMALLATFQDANALPPEGTPQANQLIHGLIQLQSALVKSQSPHLAEYLDAATHHWDEGGHEEQVGSIQQDGLTSSLLAALVTYAHKHPMWDQPELIRVFQTYNVTCKDWELISQIFTQSNEAFRAKGVSIHQAYRQWRIQMPGGG
jgi:hypothetical protein